MLADSSLLIGSPHIRLKRINSTNAYALDFISKSNPTEGTVISASFQYAGKGQIGRFWEMQGCWESAIECYRKGMDVDDLVEVFYQRLMVCCLNTYRLSEGMSIYRRCRQTLSIVLSLQPEPETESLYLALKTARLGKQSA